MAFVQGLSGIKAADAELKVIGNNIANVGTTGFKQSRAEFVDIYGATNLGTSALSIGSGARLSAISQQHTQGNVSYTNSSLDLAINGQGYFRLDDNGQIKYTRAGAFQLDSNGFVVNAQGQRLTTYQIDPATGQVSGQLGPLFINPADAAPQATAQVQATVQLDAAAAQPAVPFNPGIPQSYNYSTSLTVYDSLGASHLMSYYFVKDDSPAATAISPNIWQMYTYMDGVSLPSGGNNPTYMEYNTSGALSRVGGTLGTLAAGTAITYDPYSPGGIAPMVLNTDFLGSTQYGSSFATNRLNQDGYTTGRLASVDINNEGLVYARYSNGQSTVLGQVALTNFANPQGLRSIGDTEWVETFDSGAPVTGAPGTSTLGLVKSSALEDSNVDLTEQLVKMITAQRNYQASAQVIRTADTVTQTIINIR